MLYYNYVHLFISVNLRDLHQQGHYRRYNTRKRKYLNKTKTKDKESYFLKPYNAKCKKKTSKIKLPMKITAPLYSHS